MSGVSIGLDEEDGSKVVVLYVEGQGRIVFGSELAIIYGNTMVDFGHTAKRINNGAEECEEYDEFDY